MTSIEDILDAYPTITLEEMKGVRLMNRIDTKYVTTESMLLRLLERASGMYKVQVIDGMRNMPYHTVYYDTDATEMYSSHLHGKLTRQKVRERVYENDGTGFLEIKLKNNRGRTRKKRVEMNTHDDRKRDFINQWSRHDYSLLTPKLENRFSRVTLVDLKGTERITIDTSLRFHHLETDRNRDLSGLVIIEVKRDGRVRSDFIDILREFRVKEQGFSKYCIGMALTDSSLKYNRFKPRLRLIEKILNG